MVDSSLTRFLAYLEQHCAGVDRSEFTTAEGQPDTAAARAYAEQLRDRFADSLGDLIDVEQRVNVVRVTSLAQAAPV
ncbi:MAG: hypothetical protein EA402_01720 [Planctomycetota bacterium]|nr:MAG: hypothetical protein EA402_01720 [Planctomycetota bacterium]